jgi:hypothetical protein
MSNRHLVKSWPEFFNAVADGAKRFELRKNDRNYQAGDLIVLQEFDPKSETHTGREFTMRISYVMHGAGIGCIEPLKGLAIGYAILGLMPTSRT